MGPENYTVCIGSGCFGIVVKEIAGSGTDRKDAADSGLLEKYF